MYAGGEMTDVASRFWAEDLFPRTARGIPFYVEQQSAIAELAQRHWQPGTLVVDLGCSTGTTLISICSKLAEAHAVGVDRSRPMLERAAAAFADAGLEERIDLVEADLDAGIAGLALAPASVVTICWTLHFLLPDRRERLLREARDLLVPGGALIVMEQIAPAAENGGLYADLSAELRRHNGHAETATVHTDAPEVVLAPSTIGENLALLRAAGFESPSTFLQWHPSVGFLAVKPVAH